MPRKAHLELRLWRAALSSNDQCTNAGFLARKNSLCLVIKVCLMCLGRFSWDGWWEPLSSLWVAGTAVEGTPSLPQFIANILTWTATDSSSLSQSVVGWDGVPHQVSLPGSAAELDLPRLGDETRSDELALYRSNFASLAKGASERSNHNSMAAQALGPGTVNGI